MMSKKIISPFTLYPEDSRLATFPIFRQSLWSFYEKAQRSYWVPNEISLAKDVLDFEKLTAKEKHFIKYILAFFATSDGIVNINLAERFKKEVPILEAQYFYDYQIMMENIHAQMYSILIDTFISNKEEKHSFLTDAIKYPAIDMMAAYMFETIGQSEPLAKRLIRMACVEGIFFSGCFCAIYWLQNRGLMGGLAHSNELISRDEALHTLFALELYSMLQPLPDDELAAIVSTATNIAIEFAKYAIPDDLIEMNSSLMSEYIKTQADNILTIAGSKPHYYAKNPFSFMEQINLLNHTDFFVRRVSEYSKASSVEKVPFEISYDF